MENYDVLISENIISHWNNCVVISCFIKAYNVHKENVENYNYIYSIERYYIIFEQLYCNLMFH